jgi:hypothetical protein
MAGMGTRLGRIALAASVVALVAGSGAASAASARPQTHLVSSFEVKGSHGYRVHVEFRRAARTLSGKGARHLGKVTVRAHDDAGSASYTAPAKFNRRRVRANLGSLGSIALHVDRKGGFWLPPAKTAAAQRHIGTCEQGGVGTRKKFHGVFRFRGEGSYTRVRLHHVVVDVMRTGPISCTGHDHGTKLKAVSGTTRFVAALDAGYQATFFHASIEQRAGAVRIDRQAYLIAASSDGAFTFDSGLTSAHVAPAGAPFSGSANYSPGNWTGSLTASFPGDDNVPLTGPNFDVSLKGY